MTLLLWARFLLLAGFTVLVAACLWLEVTERE